MHVESPTEAINREHDKEPLMGIAWHLENKSKRRKIE